jgi:manganese/zinc/iron transport system permease protein
MHPLAARFIDDTALSRQLARFFAELVDSRVGTTDLVLWGAVLLGVTCGLLGCFIVLRRQSLLGDAIGHSVLPGVCVGFLFAGTKSTPALLVGAMISGLIATALIALLQRTTHLKAGECMGAVFTGFYALGIVLLKAIQNLSRDPNSFLARNLVRAGLSLPSSGQAGLEKFLFGQVVGVSPQDVALMAVVAGIVVLGVILFWRKLAVSTFDEGFAHSIGLPVRSIHYLLTALVTIAIVISIQAVGVVLVAAMLVTPAATAYLLTDRLHRMALLSCGFGAAAGVLGAFFSLFGDDLPTGAFMVLGASTLFAAAFLLAPRHGLLPRWLRVAARRRTTQAENLLSTMYRMMEARAGGVGADRRFGLHEVAAARHESTAQVKHLWRVARRRGWVEPARQDPMVLTDDGMENARRVVRNHRLWELFLTQEANLAHDHVHADAEYIEHVLSKDVLERLERMLDNPKADPHGRAIP